MKHRLSTYNLKIGFGVFFLLFSSFLRSQVKEETKEKVNESQETGVRDSIPLEETDALDKTLVIPDSLKNMATLSFLYINHDENLYASSILTLEYIRKEKKNTFIGRLNATSRHTHKAYQGMVDWYHKFKKSYTYFSLGVSDRFFPKIIGGFSFHQAYKKAWETEFGTRYFYNEIDDIHKFFGVLGLTKETGRFWINLRYTAEIEKSMRSHFALQTRMYLNDQPDYLVLLAGYGNIPEAENMNILTHQVYSVVNTVLGGGYSATVWDRFRLNLLFNWFRFEVKDDVFSNQFHGFLSVGYKF